MEVSVYDYASKEAQLFRAVLRGDTDRTVWLMCDDAKLDCDYAGMSLRHVAAARGDPRLMEVLEDAGVPFRLDADGNTPDAVLAHARGDPGIRGPDAGAAHLVLLRAALYNAPAPLLGAPLAIRACARFYGVPLSVCARAVGANDALAVLRRAGDYDPRAHAVPEDGAFAAMDSDGTLICASPVEFFMTARGVWGEGAPELCACSDEGGVPRGYTHIARTDEDSMQVFVRDGAYLYAIAAESAMTCVDYIPRGSALFAEIARATVEHLSDDADED